MNKDNANQYVYCKSSEYRKDVIGTYGYITKPNYLGNVMYYPEDGNPCYRICLSEKDFEIL